MPSGRPGLQRRRPHPSSYQRSSPSGTREPAGRGPRACEVTWRSVPWQASCCSPGGTRRGGQHGTRSPRRHRSDVCASPCFVRLHGVTRHETRLHHRRHRGGMGSPPTHPSVSTWLSWASRLTRLRRTARHGWPPGRRRSRAEAGRHIRRIAVSRRRRQSGLPPAEVGAPRASAPRPGGVRLRGG